MLSLARLTLTDFRNWAALNFAPGAAIAVITGANGSGKTNLLEAISLLAPGRGLRGARLAAISRRDGPGSFAAAAQFHDDTAGGPFTIGTAYGAAANGTDTKPRRQFRLNGAEPENQAEIASLLSAVWVTPQMDQLFEESASGRRRFLDRLVVALDPSHAREAAAHEAAMARRNRLLAESCTDQTWLAAIEDSMARHGVALAAARQNFAARINLAAGADGFPRAELRLHDAIGTRLQSAPALAVETWLRGELNARRGRDREAGGATLGAHRADMMLVDGSTGEPAASASTGQRRALLLGIILTHAALIADARGTAPILLLDEPLVHLDTARREALFAALANVRAQVLLTGTDPQPFAPLASTASFWRTHQGSLLAG